MTDEDLILRYYSGDEQAFEELYAECYRRLVGFFRHLGFPGGAAEDLAEVVFLKVINTASTRTGRYNPAKASFKTWLYGIAMNVARDQWRRDMAGGSPEALDRLPPGLEPAHPAPNPEKELRDKELFHKCLERLDRTQRAVLVLRSHGHTLQETADILSSVGFAGCKGPSSVLRIQRAALSEITEFVQKLGMLTQPGKK